MKKNSNLSKPVYCIQEHWFYGGCVNFERNEHNIRKSYNSSHLTKTCLILEVAAPRVSFIYKASSKFGRICKYAVHLMFYIYLPSINALCSINSDHTPESSDLSSALRSSNITFTLYRPALTTNAPACNDAPSRLFVFNFVPQDETITPSDISPLGGHNERISAPRSVQQTVFVPNARVPAGLIHQASVRPSFRTTNATSARPSPFLSVSSVV